MRPEEKDTPTRRERRSYRAPVLTEYGTVEDLTKGGGAPFNDFGLPGSRST